MKGAVIAAGNGLALTDTGAHRAQNLVRSHRLWEIYLVEKMGLSPDQLAKVTANRTQDPHQLQIPPEELK